MGRKMQRANVDHESARDDDHGQDHERHDPYGDSDSSQRHAVDRQGAS